VELRQTGGVAESVTSARCHYEKGGKKTTVLRRSIGAFRKTADLPSAVRRDRLRAVRKVGSFHTLIGVLALLVPQVSRAAIPKTVQLLLRQHGTESCITQLSLENTVEQRLNRHVFVKDSAPDLKVTIDVVETTGQTHVDISLAAGTGQDLGHRFLDSPRGDCQQLYDSLALVLALMIDLNRDKVPAEESITTDTGQANKTEGTEKTTSPSPKSPSLEVSKLTPSNPRVTLLPSVLTFGGFSVLGSTPHVGFGLRGAIEWHHSRTSFELGVATVFSNTESDRSGSKAVFSQYLTDPSICFAPLERHRIRLRFCGGIELGMTHAEGRGYLRERAAFLPTIAPLARTNSTWWPTPRFGLGFGVGVKTAVYREHFYVLREDGSEHELFRPSVGAVFLQADVCVKL
jgi:hypothetical protein